MSTVDSKLATALAALALAACGGSSTTPDACTLCVAIDATYPAARILPGGGIGDSPATGQVHVYAIDDDTRLPIAGATVRIGSVDGSTDATGLFTATDPSLTGSVNVAVKATGYESVLWVATNGANVTIDLKPAIVPVPDQATLSGTVAGFSGITVGSGHTVVAAITYSHDDQLEDAANNLTTPASGNICTDANCTFSVVTRTGHVALIAAIYDRVGTTNTLIQWAYLGGLTVTNGVPQTGLSLALIEVGDLADETVDFGTPPAALSTVAGAIGVDLPTDGMLQLPVELTSASPTLLAPKLAAFPAGAAYRLTGLANNGTGPTDAASVVLRHPLTTATLAAGTWLDPPAGISVSSTAASWSSVTGALAYTVDYKTTTERLLTVTTFDATTTSITIPDVLQLSATSGLTANVAAIAATLDVTNFALDTDREKLTAESAQPITVGS